MEEITPYHKPEAGIAFCCDPGSWTRYLLQTDGKREPVCRIKQIHLCE